MMNDKLLITGSEIYKVVAIDNDGSSTNRDVNYRLDSAEFEIDNATGSISTRTWLKVLKSRRPHCSFVLFHYLNNKPYNHLYKMLMLCFNYCNCDFAIFCDISDPRRSRSHLHMMIIIIAEIFSKYSTKQPS